MSSPRSPSGVPRLYQIDFTAVQTGKHIASTKRRVRWRFGFANAQALERGQTGTACRGSEHEVTFIWSITSGKCVVMADGQEVHYSTTRSSVFDYSWTMKGNHILKIVAHANPPLSQTPNFRQYDFFVNGQSFFTFPKVFRLGLAPGQVASPTSASSSMIAAERGERRIRTGSSNEITSLEAPHNPDEEEAYLQEAIRQSLQDDAKPKAGGGGVGDNKARAKSSGDVDLLDFGSSPSPGEQLALSTPAPPQQQVQQHPYSYGGVSGYGAGAPPPPSQSTTADPFGYSSTASMPALPPSTSTAGYGAAPPAAGAPVPVSDPWGAAANTSMASLPPTTSGTNGYGPPSSATTSNGYGNPAAASSTAFLSTSLVPAVPSSQAAQSSPWALPVTQQQQQQHPPFAAAPPASSTWPNQPPPAAAPPYNPPPAQQYAIPGASAASAAPPAASPWAPPPPIQTQYGGSDNPFGGGGGAPTQDSFGMPQQPPPNVPSTVTPYAQPATPSTIGFMSPAQTSADFAGFGSPEPNNMAAPAPQGESALFSMNALTSFDAPADGSAAANANGTAPAPSSTSLADQAYSKLVNMDTFSIVSKNDAPRSNPFDLSSMNSTIGGTQSLADIQAKKASSSSGSAKPIMNTPMPAPGAMVMSTNQNGSYGGAYGVQPQQMQQQAVPQYYGGQAQPPYGAAAQQPGVMGSSYPSTMQAAPPAQAYGGPPQAYGGAPYGQPPQAPGPAYGQASFGLGAAPPPALAQPSYGAYGAPPPTHSYY